jgi:PTS system nitrogen regulatory IIA component
LGAAVRGTLTKCIFLLFLKKVKAYFVDMQLTVKEASKLLKLSEKEIYRLIRKDEIPAFPVSKSYLFNRVELLEWAIEHNITISPEIISALSQSTQALPEISSALLEGGIYYDVKGVSKQEVLRETVSVLSIAQPLDKETLLTALIAREMLSSTAIGNGIAIPHVRNPIILKISQPLIVLSFLKTPIDFGALDGQPVTTLFMLISTTVRVHLHLLALLSYLLHNPALQQALKARVTKNEIINIIKISEQALPLPAADGGNQP